jgi:hypothetical protein
MSEYIDAGLCRMRRAPLRSLGSALRDADGRFAQFSLDVRNRTITDVHFTASACATLVAYCELAVHQVIGQTLDAAARRVCPTSLAAELPFVPGPKRGRALLASRAIIDSIVSVARDCS